MAWPKKAKLKNKMSKASLPLRNLMTQNRRRPVILETSFHLPALLHWRQGEPFTVQKKQRCRLDGKETNGSKFMTSNGSDFSDPIYKEIAMTNGCINRMSKEELRAKLSEFKLETRGVKDVLKKRLKNYYKKQKLMLKESSAADSYYDYICIIDFEATCEEGNPAEFLHEIIEFPVVLLNTHTLEIVLKLVLIFKK